jgi:hypothetical protein
MDPPSVAQSSAPSGTLVGEAVSAPCADVGVQVTLAHPAVGPSNVVPPFRSFVLEAEVPFDALAAGVRFQDVASGRRGAVLVECSPSSHGGGVPLVRTTSKYVMAPQHFAQAHSGLARHVEALAGLHTPFNNALIETYTNAYATMGFHSDQAQDLADGTWIAVYSCYRNGALATSRGPPRKLVVKSKVDGSVLEIPMVHSSVILFSIDTNRHFCHKIVLDYACSTPENEWLGVTLRTSKTFLRFGEAGTASACFEDGTPLAMASEEQQRQFYKLRGQENATTDFVYPIFSYTVSQSDTLPPAR